MLKLKAENISNEIRKASIEALKVAFLETHLRKVPCFKKNKSRTFLFVIKKIVYRIFIYFHLLVLNLKYITTHLINWSMNIASHAPIKP